MDSRELLPPSKNRKRFAVGAFALLTIPLILYLCLLTTHAYWAWQTSRMLDRVEALRIGDPVASFLRAVRGCSVDRTASGYACAVFGRAWLQKLMRRLPYDWVYRITEFESRVGLRGGYTVVWCSVNHDRIEKIGLLSIVGGRYESLGMEWQIAHRIPVQYDQPELSEDDRRTYMHWSHITSAVSGGGFCDIRDQWQHRERTSCAASQSRMPVLLPRM